jgi:hypothetical protein
MLVVRARAAADMAAARLGLRTRPRPDAGCEWEPPSRAALEKRLRLRDVRTEDLARDL